MSDAVPAPEDPSDLEAWRAGNELAVAFSDALDRWADSAHAALVETARRYGAFISNAELAARAQADAGIVTRAPVRLWVTALQRRITDRCQAAGEPPLVAFMVAHDHTVGAGYAYAVSAAGLPVPADLDQHAAAARFAAHLHFGAPIPAGAGPRLPPKLDEAKRLADAKAAKSRPATSSTGRTRATSNGRVVKARPSASSTQRSASSGSAQRSAKPTAAAIATSETRAPKLCPSCFTQLAANGECGFCY